MKYIIIEYQRGNHSDNHIFNYGTVIYETSNKIELKKEIENIRKCLKRRYLETSTNLTLSDYLNYEMSIYYPYSVNDCGDYERFY